ncbi:hypothetical protein QFZ79_002942 [Arthrobacter sp. V4I6]|uniref:hypothetical protein n=1 Tax=Arthrobacter sp. V4I6 TaxID=3042281 RepID=UPI00277FA61C|nr:hypothetical protein [Arthrobacter sp. V4I6]MDQ0854831.1 hypothetical protein [Arthrobacter sp. V4I6]
MNELQAAVRQAINDSEGAAGSPDELLTLQARAAVEAMERSGYVRAHGVEYAVKRGDVTVAAGFNTEEQARESMGPGAVLVRRWVGVWEPVE